MIPGRRVLFWTVGIVSIVVIALFFWGGPRSENPAGKVGEPKPASPDYHMRLTDMEYTEVQGGREIWRLRAEEAEYFEDAQKTRLQGVRLELFLENGGSVVLRSREGLLYAGSKDIELWGDIEAVVPQGYVARTERLYYEHRNRRIRSDTPVKVTGPRLDLRGDRWRYEAKSRKAIVEGHVVALVRMEGQGAPSP